MLLESVVMHDRTSITPCFETDTASQSSEIGAEGQVAEASRMIVLLVLAPFSMALRRALRQRSSDCRVSSAISISNGW